MELLQSCVKWVATVTVEKYFVAFIIGKVSVPWIRYASLTTANYCRSTGSQGKCSKVKTLCVIFKTQTFKNQTTTSDGSHKGKPKVFLQCMFLSIITWQNRKWYRLPLCHISFLILCYIEFVISVYTFAGPFLTISYCKHCRTLHENGAMLQLLPSTTVCMWSEAMMVGHVSVQLSVWTTQQMKMVFGTPLPQWTFDEAWQELLL